MRTALTVKCIGCGQPVEIPDGQVGANLECGDCGAPVGPSTHPEIGIAAEAARAEIDRAKELRRVEVQKQKDAEEQKRRAREADRQRAAAAELATRNARERQQNLAAAREGITTRSGAVTLASIFQTIAVLCIVLGVLIVIVAIAIANGPNSERAPFWITQGFACGFSSLFLFAVSAVIGLLADIKQILREIADKS